MYAVCVYWPFTWNPIIGSVIGGAIVLAGIGQFVAILLKKPKEDSAAEPAPAADSSGPGPQDG